MYLKISLKNRQYNVYYNTYNTHLKRTIILLHGWGTNSDIFKEIIKELDYYVVTFDFLGFGKSDDLIESITLNEYVEILDRVIEELTLKDFIILGHSFGGRVALKYLYLNKTNKVKELILVDSAGLKSKNVKLKYKILKYKIKKLFLFLFSKKKYYKLILYSGSSDYKKLNNIMRHTMSNVIKEDLKKLLPHIKQKTSIIWGIKDEETPLKMAFYFHKNLISSRMFLFYHSSHFPFLEEKKKFIKLLNEVKR